MSTDDIEEMPCSRAMMSSTRDYWTCHVRSVFVFNPGFISATVGRLFGLDDVAAVSTLWAPALQPKPSLAWMRSCPRAVSLTG